MNRTPHQPHQSNKACSRSTERSRTRARGGALARPLHRWVGRRAANRLRDPTSDGGRDHITDVLVLGRPIRRTRASRQDAGKQRCNDDKVTQWGRRVQAEDCRPSYGEGSAGRGCGCSTRGRHVAVAGGQVRRHRIDTVAAAATSGVSIVQERICRSATGHKPE